MKTPEDEAFDELAKRQGDWGGGFPAKRQMAADKLREEPIDFVLAYGDVYAAQRAALEEALAQPVQTPVQHWSDCAVHNGPAYPAGECDCGVAPKSEREALKLALEVMQINLTLLEKIDPYKGQEDLLSDSLDMTHEAIASIEAALAQPAQEPAEWLTGCPTCGMDAGCDCDTGTWNPPPPAQEPVYNITVIDNAHPQGIPFEDWVQPTQEPDMQTGIAYQKGFHDGKQAALAGREWNFCERCGKRTADLTVIHTCTPPQEKNNE